MTSLSDSPTDVALPELLHELEAIGLGRMDVHKSAFLALTYHQGWNMARIGRYLGVSRVRADQRLERLGKLIDKHDVPLTAHLIQNAQRPKLHTVTDELPVAFPSECWADETFAAGMLQIVSDK